MGQEEVLRVIEKASRPISAREIIDILLCSEQAVFSSLKNLLDHHEINYQILIGQELWDYCEKVGIKKVKQKMFLYSI